MLQIYKRNGILAPYDEQRIVKAINKAFMEIDNKPNMDLAETIARTISEKLASNSRISSVEEIQDLVEEFLMRTNRTDVARAYIRYRYEREKLRKTHNNFFKEISEKLAGQGIENSNANMDENSFSGRVGTASDIMMKQYALDYCLSKMARENHENNEIYIHDLNHYALGDHNCLVAPLDHLLANGFNTRQIDVRPAQSISTALQLVAVIFQLQSLQQFGGVSAGHLDFTLVPYVRKSFYKHYKDGVLYCEDKLYWPDDNIIPEKFPIDDAIYKKHEKAYKYAMMQTEKELHQAVEGLYHNLNTLQSRSGGQLPFSSINYGLCTLPEGRMVTKALLEVSIEGLGKLHRTSIFPCGIFVLKKGVNREPGDPNYDLFQLALKSTSQRLYPNYCNADWSNWSDYNQDDPRTYPCTMGKCKCSSCKIS